jgi:uridine kinase
MTSQQRTHKRINELKANSSTVPWRRVVEAIARKRDAVASNRTVLVGISGIDGSGKGFVTAKLADGLRAKSLNVALISADDWLNLPKVSLNPENYAEHFYRHAIRLDEMFERLIVPLKYHREINITADCADAKATTYRERRYDFRNIDIVLLEGIFLFKRGYRHQFDLRVWIDCSFGCALERLSNAARKVCHQLKRARRSRRFIFLRSESTSSVISPSRLRIAFLRMMNRSRSHLGG